MAEDCISYAFIASHPTDAEELGDEECTGSALITSACTFYLGARAPAFRPYV